MKNITAKIAGKYFDDENTQSGLEDMLRYDRGHIEEYQFDEIGFSFIASLEKLTHDRWSSFGFSIIDTGYD